MEKYHSYSLKYFKYSSMTSTSKLPYFFYPNAIFNTYYSSKSPICSCNYQPNSKYDSKMKNPKTLKISNPNPISYQSLFLSPKIQ